MISPENTSQEKNPSRLSQSFDHIAKLMKRIRSRDSQSEEKRRFVEFAREVVLDALRNGHEISVFDFSLDILGGAGDRFLQIWSYRVCLEYLCEQNGINKNNIHLSLNEPNDRREKGFPFPASLGTFQREFSKMSPAVKDKKEKVTSIPESCLRRAADLLGITLPREAYGQIPTPFSYENNGKNIEFDVNVARKSAQEIKEKFQGRKIIVINQAGSVPEKRFSDEQVEVIGKKLKIQLPGAAIVVVSDGNIGKTSNDVLGSKGTLGNVEQGIDLQVNIQSIQELSNYVMAASLVITTDTFWSWWSGGTKVLDASDTPRTLRPNEMIVLHTVADQRWQVPGSTALFSSALSDKQSIEKRNGMISSAKYRASFSKKEGKTVDPGIFSGDIEMLLQKISHIQSL
jgi:hypothetical protein